MRGKILKILKTKNLTIRIIEERFYGLDWDRKEVDDLIEVYIDDIEILSFYGSTLAYAKTWRNKLIRRILRENKGFTRGQQRKWFSEIARKLKEKGIIRRKAELCGILGELSILRTLD